MSLESFNAFMAKINAEETLRNELKQANPDGMTIDALAAVAAQHGFRFDAQDVSNELSEKELDLVAGGGATYTKKTSSLNEFDFETSRLQLGSMVFKW